MRSGVGARTNSAPALSGAGASAIVTPSSSAPAKLTSNEESSAIEAARSGVSLKGVYLESLSWVEAEPLLRSDPLIVIPMGAATKEHGPHLPLNTDRLLADHFARRLAERVAVVLLPTITYGYFPHFSPFPGSTHLEAHTFEATMREIILSMHRHGPRRFLSGSSTETWTQKYAIDGVNCAISR